MKSAVFTFLICALLFSNVTFAQSTNEETITKTFFETFKTDPGKAYSDLFKDNKWMKDKQADLETIRIKLVDFFNGLGVYYGYEAITEKGAGESYILKSFLVKCERQPVRFTFLLYRPNKTWQIQNFTYDTGIEEEVEEAAKAYRLKNNW